MRQAFLGDVAFADSVRSRIQASSVPPASPNLHWITRGGTYRYTGNLAAMRLDMLSREIAAPG